MLCINCRSELLDTLEEDGNVFYSCRSCGHKDGRAIITSGIKVEFMNDGQPKHFSVGAAIRSGSRFLIIKRRVWPYVYSIIAGHIDAGESPEEAIVRELKEEIGIPPLKFELVAHEPHLLGDKCRKGADVHEYYLFECEIDNASIALLSEEASKFLWVSADEAEKLEFDFAAGYMLRKAGLLAQST